MNKHMNKITFWLVIGILLLGCNQDIESYEDRDIIIFFSTKSLSASLLKSVTIDPETYINDILVFCVDENGSVEQNFFIPQLDEQSLSDGIVLENVSRDVKSLYAIANPPDEIKTAPYPSNVSELLSMTCAFSSLPKPPFVMSGIGDIVSGYVAQIDLVRTIAKIEITASTFIIEKITVINTPNEVYVFKKEQLSVPEGSIRTFHEIVPLTSTYATLYVAENSMNTPTQFIVTGLFDGQTIHYSFDLTQYGAKLDIERNKHYQVGLTAVTHSEGKITITIPEWGDVVSDVKIIPTPQVDGKLFINIPEWGDVSSDVKIMPIPPVDGQFFIDIPEWSDVVSDGKTMPMPYMDGNFNINIPEWSDVVSDVKIMPRPYIPPDPPNPPNQPDYINEGIKILAIGNSYSEDALRYLFDLLTQLGVNAGNTKIVNAYISGGTFQHHADNIRRNNYNNLERQLITANGTITKSRMGQFTLLQLLQEENWDIITVQQQNGTSTNWTATDNQNFNILLDFVKNNANRSTHFRLGWHMTWAFTQSYFDSNRWLITDFGTPYRMYELICSAVQAKIVPDNDFDFIIPTGTAIQNAKSTALFGDNLTHDGSHLNNLGCYIGSAMWVKTLTGYDISNLRTPYVANKTWGESPSVTITPDILSKVVQAVNAADASPFRNTY